MTVSNGFLEICLIHSKIYQKLSPSFYRGVLFLSGLAIYLEFLEAPKVRILGSEFLWHRR